jgi:uncharacterized membrane protein YhaH (DUF805 family)
MRVSYLYRFEGRIGRREFALTQIGVLVASYVATFLLIVIGGAGYPSVAKVLGAWSDLVRLAALVLAVNALWMSVAAAVKRCHDRNLDGWMLLFAMPPVIGQLWLFLSLVLSAGDPAGNRFGPAPAGPVFRRSEPSPA